MILRALLAVGLAAIARAEASQGQLSGDSPSAVIVTGVGGEDAYATRFASWAAKWEAACAAGEVRTAKIEAGGANEPTLAKLQSVLAAEPKTGAGALWIVLVGHGTFDGKEPKFNLVGDDVSAATLAEWLKPFGRPLIVVASFSSSGAFLKPLSAPTRVVVTATKSGSEQNFAHFGGFLADAVGKLSADLDHDGQTSLLEAWLSASKGVEEFYKDEGRLATEHSLLDDNGDGVGTPASFFEGIRVAKKAQGTATPDGVRAHQIHLVPGKHERSWPAELRAERDALEADVAKLRAAKATIPENEYYSQLEAVLLQLAQVYRKAAAVEKQ